MSYIHPSTSPSEHSLFSVRSVSSSSSSSLASNDKSSSSASSINLKFGNKIKKALSRSNSMKDFEPVSYKDRKKLISNPVPITEIPVRKGSVDLKYFSFHEDSLHDNENYYFRRERSISTPNSVESSIIEEEEPEVKDEFYFTEKKAPVNKSPFDVIFGEEDETPEVEEPSSPVLPLRFKKSTSIEDKRISSASTIKLNRNSTSYRSSRITLNTNRSKFSMSASPKSPEFALFSPAREGFNDSLQKSFNQLSGIKQKRRTYGNSQDIKYGQKVGKTQEKLEDGVWSYEEEDMFNAHEMASTILSCFKGTYGVKTRWI